MISNLLCRLEIGSVSPVLLQVTVGIGLPLTEQKNVAVWFSVTVSEVGDTVTSGVDIDSPGSPLAPGCPGVPGIP